MKVILTEDELMSAIVGYLNLEYDLTCKVDDIDLYSPGNPIPLTVVEVRCVNVKPDTSINMSLPSTIGDDK